jgi:Na+/phosphate symporter
MKLFVTSLIHSISRYFVRAMSGVLLTVTIWQGISLGIDTAAANPMVAATSTTEVVDRVSDTAERQIDRAKSAIKDSERAIKKNLDKAGTKIDRSANSNMEKTKEAIDRSDVDKTKIHSDLDADKSERYSGDTPDKVRKTADRNSQQAEDFSKKTTAKAKNFFGF